MAQTPRVNYPSSAPNTMFNYDQIETVRSRMMQVDESQTEFLKINDLTQHTGLSNTFIESNFKKVILHPREIPPVEQEEKFSTLLRTKPIPEIANKEKQIKLEVAIEEGLDGIEKDAKEDMNDEAKWVKLQKEWEIRYKEHREVAKTASLICEDIIGKMDVKRRLEVEEENTKPKDEDIGTQQKLSLEDVLEFMSSGKQNGKGPLVS
ncbi:10908_t:CDS:2 [Diversispora eburnea]|uniref:10908_t:CDS:1 n=1 Tax=Diversispora eburnea TaxID=1213867 RepID=A0A9N8V063_9GLOM|nr:10908_t:CDS:2 [Diversispora eburnea]